MGTGTQKQRPAFLQGLVCDVRSSGRDRRPDRPQGGGRGLSAGTCSGEYIYIYIYITPLRFKLGGRPVLSAHLNVETAGSERKTA